MVLPRKFNYPIKKSDDTTDYFTAYHYINKQKHPLLMEKLANQSLFFIKDKQETRPLVYPILYEDEKKQCLIFFVPDQAIALEEITPTFFEGATNDYSNYTWRLTTNLYEFLEKIEILSSGYDDTLIEALKLFQHLLLVEKGYSEQSQLFFSNEDNTLEWVFVTTENTHSIPYDKNLEHTLSKNYLHKLTTQTGTLYQINSVWVSNQLNMTK